MTVSHILKHGHGSIEKHRQQTGFDFIELLPEIAGLPSQAKTEHSPGPAELAVAVGAGCRLRSFLSLLARRGCTLR